MKLQTFYRAAVEAGIVNDPRGEAEARRLLAEENDRYRDLKDDDRKFYDTDKLFNPYADSRILFPPAGYDDLEIRKVMAGIDVDPSELLLA